MLNRFVGRATHYTSATKATASVERTAIHKSCKLPSRPAHRLNNALCTRKPSAKANQQLGIHQNPPILVGVARLPAHLQKLVEVGVVQLRLAGECIAEVLHGCLAVALQVGHDVGGVVLPQQIQHLCQNP